MNFTLCTHLFSSWRSSLLVLIVLLLIHTEAWEIKEAPVDLLSYNNLVGSTFCFKVRGYDPSITPEIIWGDPIFSANSRLESSSVYDGWVKPGETANLAVLIMKAQASYGGGKKNGVRSLTYGFYALSYRYVDYCCKNGEYNTYRSKACSACQTGCLLCSGTADNCQSCSIGYGLSGSKCEKCDGKYYSGPTTPCSTCKPGCKQCDSSNRAVCLACERGYYLRNSECFECPAKTTSQGGTVATCDTKCPVLCEKCTDQNTCVQCSTGYGLSETSTGVGCSPCSSLCVACSDSDTCIKCNSKSILIRKKCMKCGTSTFSDGDTCVGCPESCIECLDAKTCTACISGYRVNSNSQCVYEKMSERIPDQAIIIVSVAGGILAAGTILVFIKFSLSHFISKYKLD